MLVFTSDNGGYLTYGKDFRNISSNGRGAVKKRSSTKEAIAFR